MASKTRIEIVLVIGLNNSDSTLTDRVSTMPTAKGVTISFPFKPSSISRMPSLLGSLQ